MPKLKKIIEDINLSVSMENESAIKKGKVSKISENDSDDELSDKQEREAKGFVDLELLIRRPDDLKAIFKAYQVAARKGGDIAHLRFVLFYSRLDKEQRELLGIADKPLRLPFGYSRDFLEDTTLGVHRSELCLLEAAWGNSGAAIQLGASDAPK